MPEIGETLRDARMHARIDVSEIEAKTKIRAKYLRALENEEWGLLPGPTFVKSFLRTYAQALGLDGKALVEEYRLNHEPRSDPALEPIVSSPRRSRPRMPGVGGTQGGPSRAYMATVGLIGAVIVALIVALLTGGGGSSKNTSTTTATAHHHGAHSRGTTRASSGVTPRSAIVSLSLTASAPVYICLVNAEGRNVIPGTELQPGASTSTYHSKHFDITLGNSSVTMFVDGRARTVPPSSEAIGYSITKAAGRRRLQPSQLPTCK
jgi:cytoskeleton protein RodZ